MSALGFDGCVFSLRSMCKDSCEVVGNETKRVLGVYVLGL